MPYSGGSSTNAGVLYQNWFLALQIAYTFFETDFDIYPEALKVKSVVVDDIVVKRRSGSFFYSAKYKSPSKKLHWSPADLNSQNIFSDFKKQHEANPDCNIVLVSSNDCYLFSEIFARARNAIGEFDIYDVLQTSYIITEWEKAKNYLGYNDLELIQFAHRVSVRSLQREEIEYLIKHRFSHVSKENRIEHLLFTKAIECSSKKTHINKLKVNNWFEEAGIEFNKKEI